MNDIVRLLLVLLLSLTAVRPAYAVKPPKPIKPPKPGLKAAPAVKKISAAHQQALLHAQHLVEAGVLKPRTPSPNTPPVTAQPAAAPKPVVAQPAAATKLDAVKPAAPKPDVVQPNVPSDLLQRRLDLLQKQIDEAQQKSLLKEQEPLWRQQFDQLPSHKSPRQWLSLLESYVLQYRRFPPRLGETKKLYDGYAYSLARLDQSNPIARRMRQLRKQYPSKIRNRKSNAAWSKELDLFIAQYNRLPSHYADDPDERALHVWVQHVLARARPNTRVLSHVRTICNQYASAYKRKSPQQWAEALEAFATLNNRLPRQHAQDPAERSLFKGCNNALQRLAPDDPVAVRMRQISKQYTTPTKSQQEWADALEEFVAQHHHLPRHHADDPDEKSLYAGVDHVLRRNPPDDPAVLRIRQIKRNCTQAPEKLLARLEDFVDEYNHFPTPSSIDGKEDKLYWEAKKMLEQLESTDPVSVDIRRLQRYNTQR